MEIKNMQTVILGEGKLTKSVYLTLDLIPINVIIKYDNNENWEIGESLIVDKIYNPNTYRALVKILCETLSLKKRDVYGIREPLPKFDFKKDEYFYEYQYSGNCGYTYFVRTKLQHSLKYWEQYKLISENKYSLNDSQDIAIQYIEVLEHIKRQGVFTRNDYFEVTNNTVNKFIRNLTT